jgi:glycosyltransferase involved in cell wall biosynthesis
MSLSVITICRNPGRAIERTCAALAEQTQPCEWVVIDGASTDGTPERLRALPRPPDVLVSEPDQGIADAFNKGLARASGEAVLFLNAGDALVGPQALSDLAAAWDRGRHAWITAGAEVRREDGGLLYTRLPPADPRRLLRPVCRIVHPATLCDTALLRAAGGFDATFRNSMDYELWLRLYARGQLPQISPVVVARFFVGGASSDLRRRLAEDRRARARHGLANGRLAEVRQGLIAGLKSIAPRGGWAYRVKERLGW